MSMDYILSPEFVTGPDSGIGEQHSRQVDRPPAGQFHSVLSRSLESSNAQVEDNRASSLPEDSPKDPSARFLLGEGEGVETAKGNNNIDDDEKALFNQEELTGSAALLGLSFFEEEIEGEGAEGTEKGKNVLPSGEEELEKETDQFQGVSLKEDFLAEMGLDAFQGSNAEGANSAALGKEGLEKALSGLMDPSDKEGQEKALTGLMDPSGKEGQEKALTDRGNPSKEGITKELKGQENKEKAIWPGDRFEDPDKGQRIAARSQWGAESDLSRAASFEKQGPGEMGFGDSGESGSKWTESESSGKENLANAMAFKGGLKGEKSEGPTQTANDSDFNRLLNGEAVLGEKDHDAVKAASFRQISKITELIEKNRNIEEKVPAAQNSPGMEKRPTNENQKENFRLESLFHKDFIKTEASSDNGGGISRIKGKDHSVFEDRILDQVKDGLRIILKRGGNGIRIRLHPPSLGQLRMELSIHSDSVRTLIVVESNLVKGIIEGNVHLLKQAFQEQGLKLEQFTVHVNIGQGQGQGGMASSNGSFRQGDEPPFSDTLLNSEEDQGVEKETPVLEKAMLGDQKINIFV